MISSWALPPDVLQALEARVAELKPGLAVESGSGESTLVLARHAEKVVSFEHDYSWAKHVQRRFTEENQPISHVSVIRTRIVSTDTPAGPLPWYNATYPQGIDFALIDGPPCRIGRGAAGFQIFPFLNPGAEVWVDDYGDSPHYKQVRAWVRLWQKTYDFDIQDRGRYAILR